MSLDLSRSTTEVHGPTDAPDQHAGPTPPEPAPAGSSPGAPDTSGAVGVLSPRLRVTAVLTLAVAALYMAACVIYNLPSSTVKVRIDTADKAVMQPWFEQDWQLFAPTPATSNAHLMISIRAVGPSGAMMELAPFDAQYPIEDLQKDSPFLPTKQPGATLAAQERFASYQKQLLVIEKYAGPQQQVLHTQLDRGFAATLDGLDRLISYEAHHRYPAADIWQVRATFTGTPMTPFSARYLTPPLPAKTTISLQTTWFPYISGVGAP